MILTDTGPLVALLDEHDEHHVLCVATAKRLPRIPLITTWPCLTEAMYLVHRTAGYSGQALLWGMVESHQLLLHDLDEADQDRMAAWMARYQNVPMDFADASLLTAAERLGETRLFTLDRDFYIYRLTDGSALEVVP